MRARDWQRGLLIGILLLVIFWLASLIWGLFGKAELAFSQAQSLKAEYSSLEERKASLSASIASLSTPRGKDAAIRTAFGVAKTGEEVIVVVPPATSTSTSSPSWWQRILNWF